MRAGLKIINNFCSLPTCSETKCKMNGKKNNYFLAPSILGSFAALNVPEYIPQQMLLIQFIQTRLLLAVVIYCWFPGYVWETPRPHFPASVVGRRGYKNMKFLRIGTKNPKKTRTERCGMAVTLLLLGQAGFEELFFDSFPQFCEAERLWRGRVPSTECTAPPALPNTSLHFIGTAGALAFSAGKKNTLELKNPPGAVCCVCLQGGMALGPMPAAGMPYMGQASFLGMRPAAPQYGPDMQKQFAEEQQ